MLHPFLMHQGNDFDHEASLTSLQRQTFKDLEVATLCEAMGDDDEFLKETAEPALMQCLTDGDAIRYRQAVLADCIENEAPVRELYSLVAATFNRERKFYVSVLDRYPSSILSSSVRVLHMLVEQLRDLMRFVDEYAERFSSPGFSRFFAMLREELTEEYFREIETHLRELALRQSVMISARLGRGNKGTEHTLRLTHRKRRRWVSRLLDRAPRAHSFTIADRDESGARALSTLVDRGVNGVASTVAQAKDHILEFFAMLRRELAFYIGAANLRARLTELGIPTVFPEALEPSDPRRAADALYDPCLALSSGAHVVPNSLEADGALLVMITGANQGGKSTFLRTCGIAQLMMQSGLFVPADRFCAPPATGVFTHFRREEDAAMNSGKLDEELGRLSEIVDHAGPRPRSMLLFNESFASTNEREASDIARQVTTALTEEHITVFFVTHLYEFAERMYRENPGAYLFLRAEREEDGSRPFRIVSGRPKSSAFGLDLYREIWKDELPTETSSLQPHTVDTQRETPESPETQRRVDDLQ